MQLDPTLLHSSAETSALQHLLHSEGVGGFSIWGKIKK